MGTNTGDEMAASTGDRNGLLSDVKVIDLTDGFGAMAARVLGDLGAEVVRVEAPDGGDGRRRPPRSAGGVGLHHAYRNAGKLLLTLDPASATDRARLDQLLAGADVVVVADGWGATREELDAAALAERHPHLVVVSLTPFGRENAVPGWTATELVAQSLAGVVYRSGVPEQDPVSAPGSYCEDVGAITAALAGMVALHHAGDGSDGAADGGAGQLVDVSAVLALAQCTDMALPLWSMLRADQTRIGAGLYPLFRCTDGLARLVLPMARHEWQSLIAWLGSPPEWTGPEWDKAMLGVDERAEVMSRLPERFASSTREEVTLEGEAAGLRITPVFTPAEVLVNDHVDARETFVDLAVGGAGTGKIMAGIFGVDGVRSAVRGPAASIDEAPSWPTRSTTGASGAQRAPSAETRPLAGLRVLEVGSGVAAPEAGRVLSEWGAEVIKVESHARPDFQRMVMGGEMNPAFSTVARNKLGFGVDLSTESGRELVRSLLPSIDVVIENNATGVIDRLGFGWGALQAANPRIVLVSTQLYGDRGPWARRKGYGPSARAVGGLTWLWAHDVDAPRGIMAIHPDHLAGRLCALGALAGVRARDRTGVGCHIDVAQFEAVIALLGDLLLAESLEAGSAVPMGNRSAEHAPWGLFRCADEADGDQGGGGGGARTQSWLALSVTNDEAWAALLRVAAGAVPDDPAWSTAAGRLAASEAVEGAVGGWLRGAVAAEVEASLQAAGVAAGVVAHARLQTTHPVFVGRGYPVAVDQPGSGPLVLEGPAFTGSRMSRPRCEPAPAIGQHTAVIGRDLLGLDADTADRLTGAGEVVPTPASTP